MRISGPFLMRVDNKGLNNRVENAHQPTRRKEKSLIKFKSPLGIQQTLSLMGKVRNIFAVDVGRYINNAKEQRDNFQKAKSIWDEAMRVNHFLWVNHFLCVS